MATKVHHEYRVGQVVDTLGSDITARDANWASCVICGVFKIIKLIQRNNRPYYLVQSLGKIERVISQQVISLYCDVKTYATDSPELKDCSTEGRKMAEPPAPEEESFPRKEQIVFLLGSEVEKLHSEIAKLTERETKLLSLLEIVKKL